MKHLTLLCLMVAVASLAACGTIVPVVSPILNCAKDVDVKNFVPCDKVPVLSDGATFQDALNELGLVKKALNECSVKAEFLQNVLRKCSETR
jgi:hypothetical protein